MAKKKTTSWRDVVKVHPAANRLPSVDDTALNELAKDIEEHGLRQPVVLSIDTDDAVYLIDGRSRLAALEMLGRSITFGRKRRYPGSSRPGLPFLQFEGELIASVVEYDCEDPWDLVKSLNVHRRHLSPEQKRELIGNELQEDSGRSDRQIAELTDTSPTTVGKERARLEQTGTVSKVDTRTGADGVKQPATKPKASTKSTMESPAEATVKPEQPQKPTTDLRTATEPEPEVSQVTQGGLNVKDIRLATQQVEKITEWIFSVDLSQLHTRPVGTLDQLSAAAMRLEGAVLGLVERMVGEGS